MSPPPRPAASLRPAVSLPDAPSACVTPAGPPAILSRVSASAGRARLPPAAADLALLTTPSAMAGSLAAMLPVAWAEAARVRHALDSLLFVAMLVRRGAAGVALPCS